MADNRPQLLRRRGWTRQLSKVRPARYVEIASEAYRSREWVVANLSACGGYEMHDRPPRNGFEVLSSRPIAGAGIKSGPQEFLIPMKRIIEFAKRYPAITAALLIALAIGAILVIAVPKIGSAINEARIGKLEQEKQQALKRAEEAEKRDLILQGQIQAKDQQISDLTSRIEDSNQRVSNAHKDTVSAKASYDKVRADAPHFNASDDAGRVRELGTDLQRLYPDSP